MRGKEIFVITAIFGIILFSSSCSFWGEYLEISPIRISDPVNNDSDDPAIWVNETNQENSLVIGTDKGTGGGLFVYDLEGRVQNDKTITGLNNPNNVDVEYGLTLGGVEVDIAVVTERGENRLRIYRLPEMTPVDGGGIPVFEGQNSREPMGIGLYKRPIDGAVYAIVSRKSGPSGAYLWQYLLKDDGNGTVVGEHVRSFGKFTGHEVEAIAVDDEMGYVYYSDETAGVRKYHANPDHENASKELAFFGTNDFKQDQEGISIYPTSPSTGYIVISDQEKNAMNIYRREGEDGDPHKHWLIKVVYVSANRSDGNEVTNKALSSLYPGGLFVAMSDNKRFHYYSWEQFAKSIGRELDIEY